MKKRLICLLLTFVMLLSVVLTGCSQKTDKEAVEDIKDTASESTITLTMYLMTEEENDEDQVARIQEEVNKITESKFKTRLVLRYFTKDEYNAALEKAFKDTEDAKAAKKAAEQALKDAIKRGEATTAASTEATEDEMITDDLGITVLKYPTVEDYQVDIFYLGGYDKFNEFMENSWLSKLDEELTSSSKLLNDYVAPQYLSYMKTVGNGTYAIPNNNVVGEYTYLLLNKEVLRACNYSSTNGFTSLTCENVADVLENVNANEYLPLWSGTGELDVSNINYFGVDADGNLTRDFSLIGGDYNPTVGYKTSGDGSDGNFYPGINIFNRMEFQNQVKKLVEYKAKGYYGNASNANKPFAVGYVKGGAELADVYSDDYEVVVVEAPRLRTEDLFANMFAVGAYTSSVSRSMKIITHLNTNAEFRNLILYGIEGENYEIVEQYDADGELRELVELRDDNKYYMYKNPVASGNLLITYPMVGELPNIRDYQKRQNRDIKIALDLGFSVKESKEAINIAAMGKVKSLSDKYYADLMALASPSVEYTGEPITDVNAYMNKFFNDAIQDINNNHTYIDIMTRIDYSSEHNSYAENSRIHGEGAGFHFIYRTWLTDMGIYKEDISN